MSELREVFINEDRRIDWRVPCNLCKEFNADEWRREVWQNGVFTCNRCGLGVELSEIQKASGGWILTQLTRK